MEAFSHALTYQIQRSINPYAMYSADYSELIDYYNYNSPFSVPNVVSSGYPQFQFTAQPSYYWNTNPTTHYMPPSPPYGFWTNHGSPVVFHVNHVAFVDEVAVMSDSVSHVTFVDEVAVMSDSIVSYEDLLEMEEQMGRVNVGLSEETISKNLKTSIANVDHSKEKEEDQGEICVVCQREYEGNETVATLHCGHCYHANCIKEWLLHKNVCPICKSTALEV